LEQLESLRVRHEAKTLNFSLLHHEVGIRLGKAGSFQQRLDLLFGGSFSLEKEFVLFASDGSSEDDFIGMFEGKTIVGIVKDDLDKRIDGGGP
jgi:hypothetical protein